MKKELALGLGLLLSVGTAMAEAGDAAKGKASFALCIACHGATAEGNPALKSPPLAGQEDWYVKAQLKKFKDGVRGTHPKDVTGMQMRPMAMTLTTDTAVGDVAAYIASLTPKKPKPTLDGDVAKGKAFYAICTTCHGPEAKGNVTLKSPSLKFLPDWYIVAQLKKYKEGVRGTNPKDLTGMQMRPMAMTLPNEQAMKDVAAYINSL